MNGPTAPRKPAGIWRRMVMIVMTGHDPTTLTAGRDVRAAHEERLREAQDRLGAIDAQVELTVLPKEKER